MKLIKIITITGLLLIIQIDNNIAHAQTQTEPQCTNTPTFVLTDKVVLYRSTHSPNVAYYTIPDKVRKIIIESAGAGASAKRDYSIGSDQAYLNYDRSPLKLYRKYGNGDRTYWRRVTNNHNRNAETALNGNYYIVYGGRYNGVQGNNLYKGVNSNTGYTLNIRIPTPRWIYANAINKNIIPTVSNEKHQITFLPGKGAAGGNAGGYSAKYSGNMGPKGANGTLRIDKIEWNGENDSNRVERIEYYLGRGGQQGGNSQAKGGNGASGYIKLYLFEKPNLCVKS